MTPNRSGKTLLEMVVVMGVISLILGLLGPTFTLMMRSEGSARRGVVSRLNLDRLATEFRNDVRAAESAALVPDQRSDEPILSITLPDLTVIQYRSLENAIRRVVLNEGQPESQEEYRLDESYHQFEIARGEPDVVSLIHSTGATTDPKSAQNRRRIVRIEAVLGRDRRFSSQTGVLTAPKETLP